MNEARLVCRFAPAVALLAACGGGDLVLPADGEPADIQIVAGNGQTGRVGLVLDGPVVAEVTDAQGRPVSGVPLGFDFEGETDASVDPAAAATGADGRAAFRVTMGTRVGAVAGRVTVDRGAAALSAPVSFTAVSADANGLAAVSGDDQSAPAGSALPDPLVVQVTDAFGNPIADVTVTWTANDGGSVSDTTTRTGADGLTSVQRTLGPTAGVQHTEASATGLAGSPVEFTHTATAGAAAVLEAVSGDGQSAPPGTTLNDPLVVRAHDGAGNPVQGLAVTWVVGQGGGTLAPATGVTGADGLASAQWTLGPAPGTNTATAVASGVGTVNFTAKGETATPSSTSTEILSDDPDPSAPGQPVLVRFRVQSADGVPDGGVRVDSDDGASCTATVADGECSLSPSTAGDRTLTATYDGNAEFAGSTDTERHEVEASPPPPPPPATPSATESSITVKHTSIARDHDEEVKVVVRDASGAELEGIVVTLSATGGGNTITPASAATTKSGEAKFSFRSSESGSKTLSAVAAGVLLADHPVITVR